MLNKNQGEKNNDKTTIVKRKNQRKRALCVKQNYVLTKENYLVVVEGFFAMIINFLMSTNVVKLKKPFKIKLEQNWEMLVK
eukprot:UN26680